MKALIAPQENSRVVQVNEVAFDVAEPFFWVDCPDYVAAYRYQFVDGQFIDYQIAAEPDPTQDIADIDPVEKLKQFLAANPDVAALI